VTSPSVPEGKDVRRNGRPGQPAVLVRGLTYRYPSSEVDVLKGIDLTVGRGEFLGITGPSGAGKSTLCLCLMGLIPHSMGGRMGGTVVIQGQDTRQATSAQITEKAAMVFQDPEAQIIGLTVEEDLAFGPENLCRAPAEILDLIPGILDTVGLRGLRDRETYSLSGGQKQRVAIAAALMMEPEILILDEPTSELDPVGKADVFASVRRLREERNTTVVMVEHQMEDLAEMADRIVVLEQGQVVADATPRQLFRDIDLFQRTQGERLPQVAELCLRLEDAGLLPASAFTPFEDEAVGTLEGLLSGDRP
jgi:energy-coupling factor transporter ATP-binding protein EcfA2